MAISPHFPWVSYCFSGNQFTCVVIKHAPAPWRPFLLGKCQFQGQFPL